MSRKILVFDTHPVQYRVPVWQMMEALEPGSIHVVYASDCSVRGFADKDFGLTFSWDEPMLSGYPHTILHAEKGTPLAGWGSLTGKGVKEVIAEFKPTVILLTGLNYKYDITAYIQAARKGIPVWLRCETQDYAFTRSPLKARLRSLVYRTIYKKINRCFFIGELNKKHYLDHGVSIKKLTPARYSTVDRFSKWTITEKENIRAEARATAGIKAGKIVIGFSGKFIAKKNPDIIFKMLAHLPADLRSKIHLYFMGSGTLENELRLAAKNAQEQFGMTTFFSGFVNQSAIAAHYLAMDILVLPSLRMGETWGLVANEAMQAGCAVIVSDAVGCQADFSSLERFRVFKEGNEMALAACVNGLSAFPRSFDWANTALAEYSIRQTAAMFIKELGVSGNN